MTASLDLIHTNEETFAQSLGFESFDAILEASEPLLSLDGELWFVVHLPDEHWLAWPFPEWDDSHRFETYEDAVEFLRPSALV